MLDKTYKAFSIAAFAAIAVGAVGVVVNMAISVPVLGSEAAAAWIQAVGSLVAIGVAIWVSYWQHERQQLRDREREDEEVSNMLFSLRDEIEVLWQITEQKVGIALCKSPPGTAFLYKWPVPDSPFVVYDGYKDRIGKVRDHELRKLIVVTYARAMALLQSFKMNNVLVEDYDSADFLAKQAPSPAHASNVLSCLTLLNTYGDQLRNSRRDLEVCVHALLKAIQQPTK